MLSYGGLVLLIMPYSHLSSPSQFQVPLLPHIGTDADGMARTVKSKQRLLSHTSSGGLAAREHGVSITASREGRAGKVKGK